MGNTNMDHSKIFGGQYTFKQFTKLLRRDLKPKTLSLVKEIYYDTAELMDKNLFEEANESWGRILQLDVFDTESGERESGKKEIVVDEIHKSNKVKNRKRSDHKNNVVTFRKGSDKDDIKEALEWLKEMDTLMSEGNFEDAFDIFNIIMDMDVLEFSYGSALSMNNMH